MKYAIYSPDESEIQEEPMYWSNELGWTTLDEADIFSRSEKETLNLPLDGQWIMIEGNEKEDECDEQCCIHAERCDGFCDHLEGHVNACMKGDNNA